MVDMLETPSPKVALKVLNIVDGALHLPLEEGAPLATCNPMLDKRLCK